MTRLGCLDPKTYDIWYRVQEALDITVRAVELVAEVLQFNRNRLHLRLGDVATNQDTGSDLWRLETVDRAEGWRRSISMTGMRGIRCGAHLPSMPPIGPYRRMQFHRYWPFLKSEKLSVRQRAQPLRYLPTPKNGSAPARRVHENCGTLIAT